MPVKKKKLLEKEGKISKKKKKKLNKIQNELQNNENRYGYYTHYCAICKQQVDSNAPKRDEYAYKWCYQFWKDKIHSVDYYSEWEISVNFGYFIDYICSKDKCLSRYTQKWNSKHRFEDKGLEDYEVGRY